MFLNHCKYWDFEDPSTGVQSCGISFEIQQIISHEFKDNSSPSQEWLNLSKVLLNLSNLTEKTII